MPSVINETRSLCVAPGAQTLHRNSRSPGFLDGSNRQSVFRVPFLAVSLSFIHTAQWIF